MILPDCDFFNLWLPVPGFECSGEKGKDWKVSEVDCSLKQLELIQRGLASAGEEAGFGLRWQRMSRDCSLLMMVSHFARCIRELQQMRG